MTQIRLDAATLAKFRAVEGRVMLCDEAGHPALVCELPPVPDREPDLPPEEWKRRANAPGGRTTQQVIDHLRSLTGA